MCVHSSHASIEPGDWCNEIQNFIDWLVPCSSAHLLIIHVETTFNELILFFVCIEHLYHAFEIFLVVESSSKNL